MPTYSLPIVTSLPPVGSTASAAPPSDAPREPFDNHLKRAAQPEDRTRKAASSDVDRRDQANTKDTAPVDSAAPSEKSTSRDKVSDQADPQNATAEQDTGDLDHEQTNDLQQETEGTAIASPPVAVAEAPTDEVIITASHTAEALISVLVEATGAVPATEEVIPENTRTTLATATTQNTAAVPVGSPNALAEIDAALHASVTASPEAQSASAQPIEQVAAINPILSETVAIADDAIVPIETSGEFNQQATPIDSTLPAAVLDGMENVKLHVDGASTTGSTSIRPNVRHQEHQAENDSGNDSVTPSLTVAMAQIDPIVSDQIISSVASEIPSEPTPDARPQDTDSIQPARVEGNNSAATAENQRTTRPAIGAAGRFTDRVEQGANLSEVDRVRFVQRVARAFRAADDQGGHVRLRLNPPELGALKVEISIKAGVMTAKLEAETTAARSMLLDNLPALRDRLAEQNVKIERFDVDLMDRSPGGMPDTARGDSDHLQREPARQTPGSSSPDDSAEPAEEIAQVIFTNNGSLNVVI